MKNKKEAFTLIELIFVIIIIGILSSIAIPRFSATRDDAKISKLAHLIQSAKAEIATSIFAKGKIPKTKEELRKISNLVREMESKGDISLIEGTNSLDILFLNRDTLPVEQCKKMVLDYNNINNIELYVIHIESNTAICRGINNLVPDINMTIAGNRINY